MTRHVAWVLLSRVDLILLGMQNKGPPHATASPCESPPVR
jgi:hypothetical protein